MQDDKRKDVIGWNAYFLGLAALASFRSKDPSTQNGACIVQEDSPVALGYNGFPRACSDDFFPWSREGENSYDTKYPYSEHSERNAIYNAARRGIALEGATLYLYSEKGYYPCDECARAIIQSGIKIVVMSYAINENTDKYDWTATKRMFKSAGISLVVIPNELISDFELMGKKMLQISDKLKEIKNRGN
jgi:dCMP deaminase